MIEKEGLFAEETVDKKVVEKSEIKVDKKVVVKPLNSKDLKIVKITLENYRNIDYKELDLNSKSILLLGKNGLGKTNIIEALYWALNGQLFSGDSKSDRIGITPVNAVDGLKTKVSIEFEPKYTFEKVYYEKLDGEGNYLGSETSYYINGGLIKQKNQAMKSLLDYLGIDELDGKVKGIDTLALLYNIEYLKLIDYSNLRDLIIDIVGEVNHQDVIKLNPTKYSGLEIKLREHNNDLVALNSALRTQKFGDKNKDGLNDEIKQVEAIINDSNKNAEVEISKEDLEEAKRKIIVIGKDIDNLEIKKFSSKNELSKDIDSKLETKKNELRSAKNKVDEDYIVTLQAVDNKDLKDSIASKRKAIETQRDSKYTLNNKIQSKNGEINGIEFKIKTEKQTLQNLLTQKENYVEVYNGLKNGESKGDIYTCPHCDKPFGLHDTKEHKGIVENKLTEINLKGKENKAKRETIEENIETLEYEKTQYEKNVVDLSKEKDGIDGKISKLEVELKELEAKLTSKKQELPVKNYNVEPILTIEKEIEALNLEKEKVLENFEETVVGTQEKIEGLKVKKQSFQDFINQEATRNSHLRNARVKSEELVRLKEDLTLVEDYILLAKELQKDMFTLLNAKVEDIFGDNIRFRLFKINIDGSVDTRVCDMLVKDIHGTFVNIKTINSGMYPIRTIEFISKVKEHYGIGKSFVLVDELFGLLDDEHKSMLNNYGEQVIGTGYKEVGKIEEIKL